MIHPAPQRIIGNNNSNTRDAQRWQNARFRGMIGGIVGLFAGMSGGYELGRRYASTDADETVMWVLGMVGGAIVGAVGAGATAYL